MSFKKKSISFINKTAILFYFITCSSAFIPKTGRIINVFTADELIQALKNATGGSTILLHDGTYTGQFKVPAEINGSAQSYITLKGSRKVILQTGDINKGNALYFESNAYWRVEGFSIQQSRKAIMIDHSNHIVLDGLLIEQVGEEGIHFRKYSSYNTVKNCMVRETGLVSPGYGEGCYIGSAKSHWQDYTGNHPDTCNYNQIENNTFGPGIAAESVDIKEGTYGGIITGNTFDGTGMKGENYADSWVDVKGNNYVIENNTGNNSLLDGYQVHIPVEGAGAGNIFKNNQCNVNAAGYGFNIQKLNGSANGNVVYENNKVTNAVSGVSNIQLTK